MFASLPMYDWPEIRPSTDRYWQMLRQSLADHGIYDPPLALGRDSDPHQDWLRPDLLFSQTCGLPYVRELKDRVQLLGTPSYDIEAGSGSYYSVLIVAKDGPDHPGKLNAFSAAFNDIRSQSGYAALLQAVIEGTLALPARWLASSSHRASIRMVSEGKADVAAIDAVSFELARRYDEHAERVKVIGRTRQTPGLPYITSLANQRQAGLIRRAVSEAMAGLGEADRDALLLTGFVERRPEEYGLIEDGWLQISDRGWQDLPVQA